MDALANSDITKYEEVSRLNYIACLNKLSYEKEKNDYLKEQQKQQRNGGYTNI
jgi:hypothetical protein